jgi:hypothetical protein
MAGTGLGSRRLAVNAVLVAGGIVVSVVLFLSRAAIISAEGALLSLGTIWLGLLPGFLHFNRAPPRGLPFMALTGLYYAVGFGLPTFLIPLAWPEGEPINYWWILVLKSEPMETFRLVFAGLAVLSAAFYFFRFAVFSKLRGFRIGGAAEGWPVMVLLWLLLAAHLAHLFVPAVAALPSVGQFLEPAGFVGYGMFLLFWIRRRISHAQGAAVLILFLAELYHLFLGGLLTPVVFAVLFVGILLLGVRMKTAFLIVAVTVLPLVAVYPFWTAFKGYGDLNLSRIERTYLGTVKYLRGGFETNPFIGTGYVGGHSREAFVPLVKRVSRTWIFSYAVEKTPDEVPYWKGETYKPLFTALVPRMAWPGKPEENVGYRFGLRYGIILPRDKTHSINLPWIVEMYVNFGKLGVVLGMGLVGIFLAFLDKLFNRRDATDLETVCGLAVLFPLFYPDSNFSLMVGSLPLFALALYLYFIVGLRFLEKRFG